MIFSTALLNWQESRRQDRGAGGVQRHPGLLKASEALRQHQRLGPLRRGNKSTEKVSGPHAPGCGCQSYKGAREGRKAGRRELSEARGSTPSPSSARLSSCRTPNPKTSVLTASGGVQDWLPTLTHCCLGQPEGHRAERVHGNETFQTPGSEDSVSSQAWAQAGFHPSPTLQGVLRPLPAVDPFASTLPSPSRNAH